ncbi:MAG TPA: hypothetical protein VMO26_13815, partial [Vicinamibacterales bacterium]|nr:hypothetical protein [Vicinamibacterales bacterium]
ALIGPALGFALSVFGLFLLWAAGLRNMLALVLAPTFTILLTLLVQRAGGVRVRLPWLGQRDLMFVAAALLVVPLITWVPYDHIREPVTEGEAYRSYFTADFIWAMSVTNEIAKGDVPPVNPFDVTEPLRYYWMAHLLSGASYRSVQALGLTTEHIVLVNGLGFGLAFVAFFYWLARAAGARPAWAALFVIVGFVANSYEGLDMLRSIVQRGDAWDRLRDTNIDAVTRWFYQGMAVDGMQRLLLYQPHHLTGYVASLAALWLVASARDVTQTAVPLWSGILLGLGVLFSTFSAVMLAPAVGLVFLVRLVQQRAIRSLAFCAVLSGGPLIVGVFISQILGYTNRADGLLLTVGLNPVALRNWPWVLFLSFGPLLLIGVPALARWSWVARRGLAPAVLIVVALAFYFLVDVPDMGGVWVGWRSGHMLQIGFAVTGAAALTALWRHAQRRWAVATALVTVVALALPTVAIDVYNAQDIDNRNQGAGFPWTLVITPPERQAFDWIRVHTPPHAVVQPEPYVRGAATWAYVPAFAERRMAAGLPISMIPLRPYEQASDSVRSGIFQASTAEEAHVWAEFLAVDYLLVGEPEQRAYRDQVERMRGRADLFEAVFRNEAILILRVIGRAR